MTPARSTAPSERAHETAGGADVSDPHHPFTEGLRIADADVRGSLVPDGPLASTYARTTARSVEVRSARQQLCRSSVNTRPAVGASRPRPAATRPRRDTPMTAPRAHASPGRADGHRQDRTRPRDARGAGPCPNRSRGRSLPIPASSRGEEAIRQRPSSPRSRPHGRTTGRSEPMVRCRRGSACRRPGRAEKRRPRRTHGSPSHRQRLGSPVPARLLLVSDPAAGPPACGSRRRPLARAAPEWSWCKDAGHAVDVQGRAARGFGSSPSSSAW